MPIILKIVAALLLLVNGMGALYGGWSLMRDPTGEKLHFPLSNLAHTPFDNYFIPGFILFVANGICSLAVLSALLLNSQFAPGCMVVQGVILMAWIVIQMLMIRTVFWLHGVFGGIGIVLIVIGFLYINNS